MKISNFIIDPLLGMPVIILKDQNGTKSIPIWIGQMEAIAIITELEKIPFTRPLTHDLLRHILDQFKIKVVRVSIVDLKSGTYYATITLENQGKRFELDSRPSDAIALALKTNAPIFVESSVIEKSQKIDVQKELLETKDNTLELLENLSDEAFGKYKM